jgi:hypothetical protein
MAIEIAPALEAREWKERRCGAVSIDRVDGETHVVLTDPDGEIVSVSGPEEVFALLALANDALPTGDPRKMTCDRARLLERASDHYEQSANQHWGENHPETAAAHQHVAAELAEFARVVRALLPSV